MATYSSERIRQGLPRTPGGPAWPDVAGAVTAVAVGSADAAVAPVAVAAFPASEAVSAALDPIVAVATTSTPTAAAERVAEAAAPESPAAALSAAPVAAATTVEVPLRRGLPRVSGGEPWPPAGAAMVAAAAVGSAASVVAPAPVSAAPVVATSSDATSPTAAPVNSAAVPPAAAASASATTSATSGTSPAFDTVTEEVTLRQGLPRVPGGGPWPPAGSVTVERAVAPRASSLEPQEGSATIAGRVAADTSVEVPVVAAAASTVASAAAASAATTAAPATSAQVPAPAVSVPAQAATAPKVSAHAAPKPTPKREPIMVGSRTLGQWAKLAVLWGGGALLAAGIIVLAARGVTTLPGVPDFMNRYPGEYHLPAFVSDGFPAWARWTHFLNLFLMVLIIRSGLLVRQQQKPDAFFTPKKGGKKISIYLWLHTSLDILWLANGIVFVVLMFVTGHWARIVPTSWEVFPNAASAMLQYLTLEWPMDDGWVNYNSLQQLMYFTVIFVAAPLAAITGVRMSEWWPKDAEKLNKLYPAPIARAIHFPVMLFFVLFILIHVFLVLTTGALKNLNHMFAGTPEVSWVGFWWFAAAVLVTAAVTWAARPLVLAPIAGAFGRVSER